MTAPSRRRPRITLRLRLAAVLALVSCGAAALMGLLVYEVSHRQREERGRDLVMARLDAAVDSFARDGTVTGSGAALDDPALPEELRPLLRRDRQATVIAEDGQGRSLWAAAPVGTHTVSVRIDYAPLDRADSDTGRAILVSALIAVLAATLAGGLLAVWIGRRLERVRHTARRVADGDLDARVGAIRGHDEIADLAASVDSMADTLGERLRGEQRFTADVAHELRTPLTGLFTAAELLPPSRPTELVQDRVKALNTLVEDLLEVSRLDAAAERAELRPVCLAEAVAGSVAAVAQGDVRLSVHGYTEVLTDPRRLDRIVTNLIVNAVKHGAPPVEVTVDGPVVTVRDHGPGFPAALLDEGPKRFRTGRPERGGGTGLGLTIATGQAGLVGAELTFTNAPDGGAQAELRLPVGES